MEHYPYITKLTINENGNEVVPSLHTTHRKAENGNGIGKNNLTEGRRVQLLSHSHSGGLPTMIIHIEGKDAHRTVQ